MKYTFDNTNDMVYSTWSGLSLFKSKSSKEIFGNSHNSQRILSKTILYLRNNKISYGFQHEAINRKYSPWMELLIFHALVFLKTIIYGFNILDFINPTNIRMG